MHEILTTTLDIRHFEKLLGKQEDIEEIIDIIKLQMKDIQLKIKI